MVNLLVVVSDALMNVKSDDEHREAFHSDRQRRSRQDQNKTKSRDFGA